MIQQAMSAPEKTLKTVGRPRWPNFLLVDLVGFAVLVAISLPLGLLINQMRHRPLPLVYHSPEQRMHAAVARLAPRGTRVIASSSVVQPRVIALEEFQAFVADKRGPVIDARPASFYAQGHVPGAINLSRIQFAADYERRRGQLESRTTDATAIYCSESDCPDSEMVAGALRELGFTRLLIYQEGWEEWSHSGLPQER